MSNLDLVRTASSNRSSGRHQIKRSISELTSPVRLHLQNNPLRKDRYYDEKVPQSANPALQLRSSLDIPRSEGATPLMSPNQSRRGSMMLHKEKDGLLPRENKEDKGLDKEQQQVNFQVEGLKQSLEDLHIFSTTTSKRLDETYYAVLEKMSALQSTVLALKDLAETSRDIHGTFEKDSRGLEHDIMAQLSSVGRFDDQKTKIESLQQRIRGSRTNMQSLSKRVDVVRERIEGWAKADKQWQDRTRKRLRVIWAVVSVVFLALMALLLSVKYVEGADSWLAKDASAYVAQLNSSGGPQLGQEEDAASAGTLHWDTPTGDEERLRAFDEL